MKVVFESSTGLEAHMILNLLQQQGIEGRIDGEDLQGGVGELSPLNVVRVLVEDDDYERVRTIVAEWEATQAPEPQVDVAGQVFSKVARGFLVGLLVGVGITYWAFSTPITRDGIDHNNDGVLDETWTYAGSRLTGSESDRNLDGVVDVIFEYDRTGVAKSSMWDDDFDGRFETNARYRNGNVYLSESDFDQDGFVEYRVTSRNDVVEVVEIMDPETMLLRKRQHYSGGRLSSAEYDSTGDGVLDTCYEYDDFEEVVRESGC